MEFDPAANPKLANLDNVPADLRYCYKQDGDSFVIDSESPAVKSSLSIIKGLRVALNNARKDAQANKVDLTPLGDYGATPAEIAQKIKEQKEALESQIKGLDINKIKGDLAKEYTGKVDSATKRAAALQEQLYSVLVVGDASQALAAAGAKVKLAMPFVQKQVKVVEANGNFTVRVVDNEGDVRISGVTGEPMTIKELIDEMKSNEEYGVLFPSEVPAGAGIKPGTTGRNVAAEAARNRTDRASMSPTEKISAGLTKKFRR